MAQIQIKVPSVGESVTEVTISRLIKNSGDIVSLDEAVVELESDKANVEIGAPVNGTLHLDVKVGDVVQVGSTIGYIEEGAAIVKTETPKISSPEKVAAPKSEPSEKVAPPESLEGKQPSLPQETPVETIRRLPEEYLVKASSERRALATPDIKAATPPPAALSSSPVEEMKRVPMTRLRKVIAARLLDAKNKTAMLTTFNEVDMSAIMEMRSHEKDHFAKRHGVKLSFLPFFVKAAAIALREFPDVGAFIEGEDIIYHSGVHMGIAVSTDKGLVVPVIRSVQSMSFVQIALAIQEIADKARGRKLTPDDMSGGTFTITNGGVFGSMLSTPILNPPQSAILGMHNIVDRPVARDGQVVIRPIMFLALSYDHRIIDGKESVSFLVRIKEILEDPAKLIMQI